MVFKLRTKCSDVGEPPSNYVGEGGWPLFGALGLTLTLDQLDVGLALLPGGLARVGDELGSRCR